MRRKIKSVADQHQEWLGQVETDGPFLALPVLKDIWPQGIVRLGDADDRMVRFKQSYLQWQRAFDSYTESVKTDEERTRYAAVVRAWIELVLGELAGWRDLFIPVDDPRLTHLSVTSPGGEITVRSSGALEGRDGDMSALLLVCAPTTDVRAKGLDGWAATEVDRMAMLLRKARVEFGIVTDGQWWSLVWAKDGKPTGSGTVNALTWAEEPLLRDAFMTLIDQRRFRARDLEQRLSRLFERSELEAEDITEKLGKQVRKSVELLVQAFSESRLAAAKRGGPDPLCEKPDDVYQAAVTIMMRVVFLLFAEERDMLPTEQLYWESYAIRDVLDQLQLHAADGEEHLDETYDAWHRLLAVSEALFGGVNYDEMRMPAYGGSLLDPARFPWLHATDSHGLRLKVPDRVMLHVFDSVQTVVVKNERRRISFRDIDVEQIGYIYEGLLGYTCRTVEGDVVLGLIGKDGEEPEIPLDVLQEMYDDSPSSRSFSVELVNWVKEDQPSATSKSSNTIARLVDKDLTRDEEAELTRLLTPVAGHDPELLAQLVSWGNLIRRDLRDIPYVVPAGAVVVSETPSRKNAGAHYTPRSLAEEVVKYALEPLVYEPGPLKTNIENNWKLKSSTAILALKVADIAAGSGAFLVAAARFLADRVTEAWTNEGFLSPEETSNPQLAKNQAVREVIARCLYGADINPMAVEMCKLSLWLVSMDRSKPFSFVDDKIFCGNSLLGITRLDQLRALHLYPDPKRPKDLLHELIDVDGKIAEASRLREELASPIDEHNPMRSTRGKTALLDQFDEVTSDLQLIGNGIIAAGLPLGGKPGARLDDAYQVLSWELAEAFPGSGLPASRTRIDRRIDLGLTPTVDTDQARWQPLHWVICAPDVFVGRSGFDAVIGNPPFLGGKRLGGAIGSEVHDWLTHVVGCGAPGGADLVAFFLRRAVELSRPRGWFGLIATNTIAQGETRQGGLEAVVQAGYTLLRAIRSAPWPSVSATLSYAAVWGTGNFVDRSLPRHLEGVEVSAITPLLEPVTRATGRPVRLGENRGAAYVGSYVLGKGFILESQEVDSSSEEARRDQVVIRYLGGDDLASRPDASASRWVLNFYDWTFNRAAQYREFALIEKRVRPERQRVNDKGDYVLRKPLPERWWQYADKRPALYRALSRLDHAIAVPRVSKIVMPVRIDTDQVISDSCVVFPDNSFGGLGLLSSSVHNVWVATHSSTLGSTIRYTPSDVFETFVRPDVTDRATSVGKILDTERRQVMRRRCFGITSLYNLINDPQIRADTDVIRLREIHVEIDEAIMAAYGWDDVPLNHGFHTYRQMERWTVSPAARVEILDRLLELNHQRARGEGQDVPKQEEVS